MDFALSHAASGAKRLASASAVYFLLLLVFWGVAQHISLGSRLGHMPTTFTAFALIIAPLWFFGFGLEDFLRQALNSKLARVLAPGLLAAPYFLYSLPRAEFRWGFL